ncbi:hypothetical protein Poli38472_012424 [Pythium oligandrum]|uniref:Uncharacterized protein n=1 Tax=Pythium oligandrum TaxID=41045 RepID=A0A8K1CQU7_PYTOL|nr:hypothetical protein Poli38472_012424 [Pythium oligandrum]|eukprot:TMW67308.1 hypothetical protein Poli38472_012424 [Pythium oligandrum]
MVTEAGCSTEPPCQTRNSHGRYPFSPHVDDLHIYRDVEQSTSVSVRDILTGRRHRIPIPQSDIDAHINFSCMRFLVSIFSLLLVISDIPRTGFSTDLPTFFPHVAPEVYMYYGPYDFPLSHIDRKRENNTVSRFDGHAGGVPIDSVSLWAHKYDTLSIAPRAVADYLRVKSFPPCVLYKGACSSPRISLETTFTMMDDLISALHNRYFQHSTDKGLPMTFYTKNRWVDRLHHFLFGKWFTVREDNRLSMIHHFASNDLAPVCSPHRKGPARPLMCDDTIAWHCESPVENATTRISIDEHVDLRLELLRQEHPTLKVELFLFSSRSGLVSTRPKLLPQVQFSTNLFQVVAFIRGQQCSDDKTCETVFIDDYRYERATLESNARLWAPILTVLRGTAQGYVWLRLAFLWWGCFRARSCELKYCHSSLWVKCLATWRTFFLIPSHVIIYSSWFPVCCYALAHLIDCDLTHLVSDNFWNSLNGFVDFNLLRYIEVASVQMRNVWWLALAWKVVLLLANSHLMIERIRQWQPFDGVLGIRDIPRTGIGVHLDGIFASRGPGIAIVFGPYNFPIAHIVRANSTEINGTEVFLKTSFSFTGQSGSAAIDSINVWTHKFDSLSIPLRAMTQHLDISSVPRCLLYKEPCLTPTLSLQTVFTMLDDLLTAIQTRYFHDEDAALPVVFHTTTYWIDRLHHVLLKQFWKRIDKRLHTVHHYTTSPLSNSSRPISVCSPELRPSAKSFVCNHFAPWGCDDPAFGSRLLIADHINQRVRMLQREYPTLHVDLTLFSSRVAYQSPTRSLIPVVHYVNERDEVVTLVRGRYCLQDDCITVFVNEYRYERHFLQHNADEWMGCLTVLRGAAQLYVWLHIVLLWWGCYRAETSKCESRGCRTPLQRCAVAWRAFFRTPGHIVVYSSWFPVCCYSLAHVIDSGIVQNVNESYWNSRNGFLDFEFLTYVRIASIQMRNIWVLALFWKTALILHAHLMAGRARKWRPQAGVLAIRAVFISVTSALTVFSFFRALSFRNTNITVFHELSRHIAVDDERRASSFINNSEFGFTLDAKTVLFASLLVGLPTGLLQLVIQLTTRCPSCFVFCRSFYIPLSAGVLYPASAQGIFWYIPRIRSIHQENSYSQWKSNWQLIRSSITKLISLPQRIPICCVCDSSPSTLHWKNIQGCTRHEHIFDVASRDKALWSIVRLVHITFLSDPWQLIRLYGIGQPLYLYRLRMSAEWGSDDKESNEDQSPCFLSPLRPEHQREPAHVKLVAEVDSSVVPWTALVNCG